MPTHLLERKEPTGSLSGALSKSKRDSENPPRCCCSLYREIQRFYLQRPDKGVLAKLQREGYVEPDVGERWKIVSGDNSNIWTAERFRELFSDETLRAVYEDRGQIESLSELGADLMNLVARNQWELTHKFRDRNFSFYFGRRLVFGINLHAQTSRLCVWVPEADVIDREDDWIDCGIMNHRHEEYYSSSGCAVYPRGVEVADIEEMLAFAYVWRSGGLE